MILYSTLPMLWGQIDGATSIKDLSRIFLNFPTLAGHLWFMYPLISIYLFIPIISPWLSRVTVKEERFFIGLFSLVDLYAISEPLVRRKCGDSAFGTKYHMLWYFSGYLGYPCAQHKLYTCPSDLEPFQNVLLSELFRCSLVQLLPYIRSMFRPFPEKYSPRPCWK